MSAHLHAHVFYGLASAACPWGDADDYDEHEGWCDRLARRAEAAGRDPAEVRGVEVLFDLERRTPWGIAVLASAVGGDDMYASPIPHAFVVQPEWAGQLRAFCEVMGVPWREPGWCVTTSVV